MIRGGVESSLGSDLLILLLRVDLSRGKAGLFVGSAFPLGCFDVIAEVEQVNDVR